MRSVATGLVFAMAALATACGGADGEEESSDSDLRSDPHAAVSTADPSVKVLSSYNSFLDRRRPVDCVVQTEAQRPSIDSGNVEGRFYLRHVKTREDLAKEL